jgi:hypothetical protein
MQESLTTLALVLAITTATAQASCLRAIDGNGPRQKPSEAPCQAWEQMVASLSQSEKETLLREGAVRKSGIGWILSESLVPDCQRRIEMAAYFARVIGGTSEDHRHDRKFAADNAKEIVRVLQYLWPSLGNSKALVLMADGAFDSEKYALLAEPAFEQDVIAPLISNILEKEGIGIELVGLLFSRPMPEVKAAISRQLTLSEGKGDVPQQIYALVLLHRLGDPTALPKLRKLSEDKNLSTFEKKLIPALLAKIRRGEVIEFSDVEDLEYENDRRYP